MGTLSADQGAAVQKYAGDIDKNLSHEDREALRTTHAVTKVMQPWMNGDARQALKMTVSVGQGYGTDAERILLFNRYLLKILN